MNEKKLKPSPWIWIDRINPTKQEIEQIFNEHNFHELDREAVTEEHQYARLDPYDDYIFLVLYFPKYSPVSEKYIQNELNIFIWKDYLITFRYYQSATIRKIFTDYEKRIWSSDEDMNDPAFLLYDIIEWYLDKTMRMLERFTKDLKILETKLFSNSSQKDTIRALMVKKRNIITLKHMMRPQIPVLRLTETYMKWRFAEEVENYFENLEDKLNKIFSEIQIIEENIESMEDTLKSIFELETNTTIKYLTIFSAFMMPLTLATSFFGMNNEAGKFYDWLIILTLITTTVISITLMYFFLKKNQ